MVNDCDAMAAYWVLLVTCQYRDHMNIINYTWKWWNTVWLLVQTTVIIWLLLVWKVYACMLIWYGRRTEWKNVSYSLETYQNATPNMVMPKMNNNPNIELVEKAAFMAWLSASLAYLLYLYGEEMKYAHKLKLLKKQTEVNFRYT